MRRREFITLLGGAAAAWPLAARAQQKMPIIGFLGQSTLAAESQRVAAFVQRLRELGWIEGRTVAIEYRWGEGTKRALCRDRSRVRPAQGRCHRHFRHSECPRCKTGDVDYTDSIRGGRRIRSEATSSKVWRDPAATLPVYQLRRPTSLESESNSCARSFPVFAACCDHRQHWQSRSQCWKWTRFRLQLPSSASKLPGLKSDALSDIAPVFRRGSKGLRDALYVVADPLVIYQPRLGSTPWRVGARLPAIYNAVSTSKRAA